MNGYPKNKYKGRERQVVIVMKKGVREGKKRGLWGSTAGSVERAALFLHHLTSSLRRSGLRKNHALQSVPPDASQAWPQIFDVLDNCNVHVSSSIDATFTSSIDATFTSSVDATFTSSVDATFTWMKRSHYSWRGHRTFEPGLRSVRGTL
jgi:hypothetical protein